ncbi:MAG: hypothetical protein AAB728_00075 [Patescibacteria group bacterium]
MVDRRARLNVRLLLAQKERELKEKFSSQAMQNGLQKRTDDIVRRMENADDKILKERARALQRIRKYATPKENRTFNALSLAMAANEEISTIDEALQAGIYRKDANPDAYQALIGERTFLEGLLTDLGVDRKMVQDFVDPSPKDEKRKKLDKDLGTIMRVVTVLGAGAMALLTGLLAAFSNKNYNATLVWLLPTVLAVMGKERLTGSRVENVLTELAFMQEKEPFVAYASKFPCQLEGPARELVGNKPEARRLLRTLREQQPKSKETREEFAQRKEEASESMKQLLNPNRGKAPAGALPGLEDRMLQDEEGFLAFAFHLVERKQSDETLEVAYRYLRDGKPPADMYAKTPALLATADGGRPTPLPSS